MPTRLLDIAQAADRWQQARFDISRRCADGVAEMNRTIDATLDMKQRNALPTKWRSSFRCPGMAPRDVLAARLTGTDDGPQTAVIFSNMMSETRFRVASIPPLVASLDAHGLRASEYLAAAEAEETAGIMFMPVKP